MTRVETLVGNEAATIEGIISAKGKKNGARIEGEMISTEAIVTGETEIMTTMAVMTIIIIIVVVIVRALPLRHGGEMTNRMRRSYLPGLPLTMMPAVVVITKIAKK